MPWMMPPKLPLPVVSDNTLTAISLASGATPIVPMPLSGEAIVPATCEPWLNTLLLARQ